MHPEELKSSVIAAGKLPEHIAIIMDGNGRWAKKRGLLRTAGHRAGVKTVKKIVRIAGDIGLKYLTLFTFSTENWKRPKNEVSAIMRLLEQTTKRELSELLENNVRLIATGNIENLPPKKREVLLKELFQNIKKVLQYGIDFKPGLELLGPGRDTAGHKKYSIRFILEKDYPR